jgi:hypothetical protein
MSQKTSKRQVLLRVPESEKTLAEKYARANVKGYGPKNAQAGYRQALRDMIAGLTAAKQKSK